MTPDAPLLTRLRQAINDLDALDAESAAVEHTDVGDLWDAARRLRDAAHDLDLWLGGGVLPDAKEP